MPRQLARLDGQHLVKEPTEPDGTQRYSCETSAHPWPAEVLVRRCVFLPYKEEDGGSSPSAPTMFTRVSAAPPRAVRHSAVSDRSHDDPQS